jgi:transcriptional regulator with XRE-family HTH domain
LSTILKRLREERGYSARSLSLEVGVSHVTILNLENGISQGHPRTRAGLTRVLAVPIDVLLMPDQNDNDRRSKSTGR